MGDRMLTAIAALTAITLGQDDSIDWSALARSDIEFIHQETQDHHPGPEDSEHPDFAAVMDRALERGLSLAERVDSQAGYAMAISAYAAQYRDGHYGVQAPSGIETFAWPGFIATRMGGRWFARSGREDTAAADGAEILDCDGRDMDDWMRETVFGFGGNPDLAADWGRRAPLAMVDRGNPFVERPVECRFSLDGDVRTEALAWHAIERSDWWERARSVSRSEPAPWGLREFAPGAYWIGTPTFGPRDDALVVMQELIEQLQTQAEDLRDAEILVFDVRGNNGGSSSWGDMMVEAVWGEAYADYRAPVSSSGVDYRISDGNIAHARWIIDLTVDQNMTEAEVYFRQVLDGMLAAREAGEAFYVERAEPREAAAVAPNPVSARVYFLTDSACGSACLDFADRMYGLEGVTHVGGETFADSDYMELRQIDFPSGHGRMGLPIKVYRGRPRASGQSYVPAVPYAGTDWSTAALEAWIARIDADARAGSRTPSAPSGR